ncbi:MAG: hypothetical protein F4067_12310 [Acidimicrobiia bacterium]|nr:hypothetical protein [Acidimicrobiia bacterium]
MAAQFDEFKVRSIQTSWTATTNESRLLDDFVHASQMPSIVAVHAAADHTEAPAASMLNVLSAASTTGVAARRAERRSQKAPVMLPLAVIRASSRRSEPSMCFHARLRCVSPGGGLSHLGL